ncbi:membrane protein [Pontibacillus yanchengensis Y32]|uniref:Membrane protein n=2 Tax=Pontibacillus yanchengensis TaxID=462910 RepID=A0A0A2THJ6_9BACI|nr:TIGR03826 family flagellar region protein [Pontibacillus yanchengensis]KGP73556.1 membrane protein [Pontibacillus yanchengensis Y32]
MGELANCPRCNALFMKQFKSICENCYKEEERDFDTVYQFIRKKENRTSTVDEVVEATGVKREVIMKFVKEGRLRTGMFPNLTYPCQKCGEPINEGKICGNCSSEINTELKREQEIEEVERANKIKERKHSTYISGVTSRKNHR